MRSMLSKALPPELKAQYNQSVNSLVMYRLGLIARYGSPLYFLFTFLDRIVYPERWAEFYYVRLGFCGLFFLSYYLYQTKWVQRFALWVDSFFVQAGCLVVCWMIYRSDGGVSHYYEGINIVFLCSLIVNTLDYRFNLFNVIVALVGYVAAVSFSPVAWNNVTVFSALFFMGTTGVFVVMMTHVYQTQFFREFMQKQQLAKLYQQADVQSKTDELTQISNRRYFFEVLRSKVVDSGSRGQNFYLIIFDVDHFKHINDTYGHAFGDQVIAAIAKTLTKCVRNSTHIGRYGGDEFMVILDHATREDFLRRAGEINENIRRIELYFDGKPVKVSASFGAACYQPQGSVNEQGLLELADKALFEVKRTSRGGILLAN